MTTWHDASMRIKKRTNARYHKCHEYFMTFLSLWWEFLCMLRRFLYWNGPGIATWSLLNRKNDIVYQISGFKWSIKYRDSNGPFPPVKQLSHIWVKVWAATTKHNHVSNEPGRRQAIFWTNVGILLVGPLGPNVSKTLIKNYTFIIEI